MKKSVFKKTLAVLLALVILLLAGCQNKEPVNEDIPSENISQNDEINTETNVERTELHNDDSTSQSKEDSEPSSTVESNKSDVLSKDETGAKQDAKPSVQKNKYKLIYNKKGQISEVEIRIYGKYNPAKTKSGDTVLLSISTNQIKVGTDEENGKIKEDYSEGYKWDFNLATKKGCLESYSCSVTDFENGSSVLGDGFPERQKPYSNAVKMDFTDEYVIISLLLDNPVDIEGKNIQVSVGVAEKTFTTYGGAYNEFWEENYSKEVPQPDIDLTSSMM